MERAAASVGQTTGQFVREAVVLRCALAAGEVTDEMQAIAPTNPIAKATLYEAVVRAGRTRLRPIVMTSLTTLVGLFPMALGIDVGSEANAPLARAVIGGLAVSTVLTLVLIPTLYVMLEERFPRRIESPEGELVAQGDAA